MRNASITLLALFSVGVCLTAAQFSVGEPVRIFGDYGKLQTLAVSPNGKLLAFSSDYRDQKGDIVVYNLRTNEKQTVTKTPNLESQPVFSRDSQSIYFFINEAGVGSIKKVHLADGAVSPVTDPNFWCEFPSISPEGRFLAYYSKRNNRYNLYEMDLSTGKETQLTSEQSFDFGPVYSSNGRQIFFYSNRKGSSFSLFRYERAAKKISPLFGPGGFTFQPTTDVHGQLLFAVSNVAGNNDVYAISLTTNRVDPVTNSPGNDLFPAVDVRSSQVYYISQKDGDYAIYKRKFNTAP